MRVAGTHVLLTGATGDIGRRLATHLSDAAARLTLVARSTQPLEALAADLGAHAVPADLTDRDTLRSLIRDVEQAHDDLENLVALNLLAPVELCRQVLPGMTARGRGHLVNISSLAGVATFPGLATYSATKAGLTHFTSGLRADLRGGPIGTLAVEIGPVSSQMMGRIASHPPTAAAFDRVLGLRALTMLDPDAVARAVVAAVEDDQATLRMPRRAAPLATLTHAPRSVVRLALTGIR